MICHTSQQKITKEEQKVKKKISYKERTKSHSERFDNGYKLKEKNKQKVVMKKSQKITAKVGKYRYEVNKNRQEKKIKY